MLEKKFIVQKSFRLDGKLENDLNYLSSVLNRPQNELVNFALENLMYQNSGWFVHNMIVEGCNDFFTNRNSCSYENSFVRVEIIVNKQDMTIKYSYIIKYNYRGNETDTLFYNFSDVEKIREKLWALADNYIDSSSEEVEKYLQLRLNYK